MSKTTDDKHDHRERTLTVEGPTTEPEPPTPRARRIPATVDDAGLSVINRAVTLQLARGAVFDPDSPELYGRALVQVAKDWLTSEATKRVP